MQDVSTDMEMKSPRVDLKIDRDQAAAVGLNATQMPYLSTTNITAMNATQIAGFTTAQVLSRIRRRGDLFADAATLTQSLPALS